MSFFKLSRRVGLFGPLHLNISKRGVSLSVRTLVSTYNIPLLGRKRPWRSTINVPGVGLSYVIQRGRKPPTKRGPK